MAACSIAALACIYFFIKNFSKNSIPLNHNIDHNKNSKELPQTLNPSNLNSQEVDVSLSKVVKENELPKYLHSKERLLGDDHLMYYIHTEKPTNADEILRWSFEKRKFPTRGGGNDTILISKKMGWLGSIFASPFTDESGYAISPSIHPVNSAICIPNDQIIKVIPAQSVKKLSKNETSYKSLLYAGVTANNKHIIQQPAVRSCVPTAIAMLLLDHGVDIDVTRLFTTNLSLIEDQQGMLKKRGYQAVKLNISKPQEIQQAIKNHGSLLFDTTVIGGHQLIIDEINLKENTAIVRDPFHGWCVTIKLDYFTKTLSKGGYHYLEKINK